MGCELFLDLVWFYGRLFTRIVEQLLIRIIFLRGGALRYNTLIWRMRPWEAGPGDNMRSKLSLDDLKSSTRKDRAMWTLPSPMATSGVYKVSYIIYVYFTLFLQTITKVFNFIDDIKVVLEIPGARKKN